MSKTVQESFNEKAHLIFEYDPQSPLFTRKAHQEIEDQNLDNALRILSRGLEKFPNHPVAIFLIAEVLTLQGKYNEAQQYYKLGSEIIDDPASFQYYQNKVLEIKKLHSPFAMRKLTSFSEPETVPRAGTNQRRTDESFSFEDSLPDLAEQLSKAKMNLSQKTFEPAQAESPADTDNEPFPIVSETLARIHASQGNFSEAIKIYQVLSARHPEKREQFSKAIADLQKKIIGN